MRMRFFSRRQPATESSHLLRLDWLEVLPTRGCALCLLAQRKSQRYVAACLDEAVTDVDQRDAWRAARGFCPWHATMAATTPHSAGSLAILYADVLHHNATQLMTLSPASPSAWRPLKKRCQAWLRRWRSAPPCPACSLWRAQELLYLQVLLDAWYDQDLQQAFMTSGGLCWPHTHELVVVGSTHPHLPTVLVAQQAHLQSLLRELQAFTRKLDYRFARAPYGPEADAWRRAIRLYTGTLAAAGPQPPEPAPPGA